MTGKTYEGMTPEQIDARRKKVRESKRNHDSRKRDDRITQAAQKSIREARERDPIFLATQESAAMTERRELESLVCMELQDAIQNGDLDSADTEPDLNYREYVVDQIRKYLMLYVPGDSNFPTYYRQLGDSPVGKLLLKWLNLPILDYGGISYLSDLRPLFDPSREPENLSYELQRNDPAKWNAAQAEMWNMWSKKLESKLIGEKA